jgi:hypothetical protein
MLGSTARHAGTLSTGPLAALFSSAFLAVSCDSEKLFESMNDRGAQLTQVDLVKGFFLSNVGSAEEKLNKRWRVILAELTRAPRSQ